MWHRFTKDAKLAILYAQQEAQHVESLTVTPQQLLIGLTRNPTNSASLTLAELGFSVTDIYPIKLGPVPIFDEPTNLKISLSEEAKTVIEYVYKELAELRNTHIGTEHLLLGLIRYYSQAPDVPLTIAIEDVRGKVRSIQKRWRLGDKRSFYSQVCVLLNAK